MRLLENFRKYSQHINAQLVGEGTLLHIVEELEEAGKGKTYFNIKDAYIFAKPSDKANPVRWLKERKCADGAFFTIKQNGDLILHIVELKSGVNTSEWEKAKLQFAGMLLNCIVLARFTELGEINEVVCYLAYRRDKFDALDSSSPILLKAPPAGTPKDGVFSRGRRANEEWQSGQVSLPLGKIAKCVRAQRDDHGDHHFGLVG